MGYSNLESFGSNTARIQAVPRNGQQWPIGPLGACVTGNQFFRWEGRGGTYQRGLLCLNQPDGLETFQNASGAVAWIDVTAVSNLVLWHISDWRVEFDIETRSDHWLVVAELSSRPSQGQIHRGKNWKRVDWLKFTTTLGIKLAASECLLWEPSGEADLEDQVDALTSCIGVVIEKQVPLHRICDFSRLWWTTEID